MGDSNLSKEEAIKLHRHMWQDMHDAHIPTGTRSRNMYKDKWLEKHNMEAIHNNCFLCQYARQQWKVDGFVEDSECSYCPLSWRKPCSPPIAYPKAFYCEQGRESIFHDWRYASALTIANLPMKEGI